MGRAFTQIGMVGAMTTRRHLVAALVTLCGAAIIAGAVLPWVSARGTRPASGVVHTSILGLRHFDYAHSAVTSSFAVALAAVGILVLVGGLTAWRLLAGPLAAIALANGGAWIVLNAQHYDPVRPRFNDLRSGAWLALGGSLLALVLTFWMRRRDALADTSPWESFEDLADRRDEQVEAPAPMRSTPAWQPGPRGDRPARRPRYVPTRYVPTRYVQTREGFRAIR
jgi:hypothetical protein